MRILANENFPGEAVAVLRSSGHDVVWVRTDAPGSKDRAILEWGEAKFFSHRLGETQTKQTR